jgi:hypothetical protein
MSIPQTFQKCNAGQVCRVHALLETAFSRLGAHKSFYTSPPPKCVQTSTSDPESWQCLPQVFKSVLEPNFEGGKKKLLIYNSAFDDCSPKAGAQSGCGKNLQCNSYTTQSGINRWNCEPSLKAENYRSILYSQLGQTCGSSTRYNNKCNGNTNINLKCEQVDAYVDGKVSQKHICVDPNEDPQLEKRRVKIRCYSGCPVGLGGQSKQI